jgi:hypothetical protein
MNRILDGSICHMAFPVPPDPNSVVRSFLDVMLLAAASLLTHCCLAHLSLLRAALCMCLCHAAE